MPGWISAHFDFITYKIAHLIIFNDKLSWPIGRQTLILIYQSQGIIASENQKPPRKSMEWNIIVQQKIIHPNVNPEIETRMSKRIRFRRKTGRNRSKQIFLGSQIFCMYGVRNLNSIKCHFLCQCSIHGQILCFCFRNCHAYKAAIDM